jgi:hypothetical protein
VAQVISFYDQGDRYYHEWLRNNNNQQPTAEETGRRPRDVLRLIGAAYTAARHLSRFADSAPRGGISATESSLLADELEKLAAALREIEFERD